MEVSKLRTHALRLVYGLNAFGVGWSSWSAILTHEGPWDAIEGVAFSFWAALAVMMFLGLLQPLKMLPILVIQLVYKSIWLAGVVLPHYMNQYEPFSKRLLVIFISAVIADLIVIPWGYFFKNYLKQQGS